MKFKLRDSDKKILIGLFGIALVVLAYVLVYMPLNEKKATLEAENSTLSQEVAYLQTLMDNKEQYIADTERMNAEMEEIKAQFPAEIYPEDELYYAYNSETEFDVLSKGMAMPEPTEVTVAAPVSEVSQTEVVDDGTEAVEGEESAEAVEEVAAAPTESASSTIKLYKAPVTFNFQITYSAVKDWVKAILEDDENKKEIETLSLTFDEKTGNLNGSMVVNMYSLTGTERTYEAPNIPGIGVGTDDLFKSADRLNTATENNTYDANAESTGDADGADNEDDSEESEKQE